MKLNISRIKRITNDYKSVNEFVEKLLEAKNEFIEYELINRQSIDRKIVFRNLNHNKMLHKQLMFEHFYIIVFVLSVVFILSLINENITMILLTICALLFIPYKLIVISEIPNRLIFEGLNIYEVNLFGKRLNDLQSAVAGTTENLADELLYVTSKKRRNEKMKMLVVKSIGSDFEGLDFFYRHYEEINFKTNFK